MNSIKIALLSTFALAGILFFSDAAGGQWREQTSGTFVSLRGVSAVSPRVVWASGNNGTYLRTTNGGVTWRSGTVPGASQLDFRDVHAVDANTAYLLSSGEGALSKIYKTTDGGAHWKLQYTNGGPRGFFDAIAFWDADHGIALSDPVGGDFLIITTADGGATWKEVPAENIPPPLPGEAAFAASGTCLTVQGKDNAWFGTGGGSTARVFRSTDRGQTWKVAPTPIRAANSSSGIFSVAFKDGRNGVAVGGDYQKPDEARSSVAVTTDGGVTWTPAVSAPPAGYRSGVAYVPGTNSSTLVAVGTSGSDYSVDGGRTWTSIDKNGYNSISFAGSASAGWAVGEAGRIAKFAGALPGKRKGPRRNRNIRRRS
jgi:photosystem II stability/assembly factor-like uncharacterized protein